MGQPAAGAGFKGAAEDPRRRRRRGPRAREQTGTGPRHRGCTTRSATQRWPRRAPRRAGAIHEYHSAPEGAGCGTSASSSTIRLRGRRLRPLRPLHRASAAARDRHGGGRPKATSSSSTAPRWQSWHPRKQWPRAFSEAGGNIKPELRGAGGRALAFGTDPGWSEVLDAALVAGAGMRRRRTSCSFRGVAAALKSVAVGAAAHLGHLGALSHPARCSCRASRTRIAELGKMELVEAVQPAPEADALPQANMDNSATQAANVLNGSTSLFPAGGGELPRGPGLLFDDSVRVRLDDDRRRRRAPRALAPVFPAVLRRR